MSKDSLSVTKELKECEEAYLSELRTRTSSAAIGSLTAEHRAKNEKIFRVLFRYQQELDAYRSRQGTSQSSSSLPPMPTTSVVYPENLRLTHYLHLRQVLPIPDIHQVSDCDTIYRFLIARNFQIGTTEEFHTVVVDILNYILFREKYALNTILVDPFLAAEMNGRDVVGILDEAITALNAVDPKHAIRKPVEGAPAPSPAGKKGDEAYLKMIQKVRHGLSRLPLYNAWRTWNIGIDHSGHLILYQKPKAEQLLSLLKRWPYAEGAYDQHTHPSMSTHDETNMTVRLHLRSVEKGRRISRLLHQNKQKLLRDHASWLAPEIAAAIKTASSSSIISDVGSMVSFVDVADISVGTFTSSKYEGVIKVFKIVSLMGQSYYPENMHRMVIINGGFMFRMLFKLVKPWLDPQTQKKIIVLSHSNKYTVEDLLEDNDNKHLKTPISSSSCGRFPLPEPSPVSPKSCGSPTSALSLSVSSFQSAEPRLTIENSSTNITKDYKHFELRTALLEYMPSHFIPAWYGGELAVEACANHYGHLLHPEPRFQRYVDELQREVSERRPLGMSIGFAAQNLAFLEAKQEVKYWQTMEKLQKHSRFLEALDVVSVLAPPEILPDALMLPMMYYGAAVAPQGSAKTSASAPQQRHADPAGGCTSASTRTSASSSVGGLSPSDTGDGLPAVVGPVTNVEAEIFAKYLESTFKKKSTSAASLLDKPEKKKG